MQNHDGLLGGIGAALSMAFAMSWEILWALILGFTESSYEGRRTPRVCQTMARLLEIEQSAL